MAPYVWVNMLSELQGLEWVRVHWMSAGLAGGKAGALPSLSPHCLYASPQTCRCSGETVCHVQGCRWWRKEGRICPEPSQWQAAKRRRFCTGGSSLQARLSILHWVSSLPMAAYRTWCFPPSSYTIAPRLWPYKVCALHLTKYSITQKKISNWHWNTRWNFFLSC